MAQRNWLPNAPLGVGLIVIVVLGALALAKHERNANNAYQAARRQYEQSKRSVTADAAAHSKHTGDKSYREEWRSEQDLDAQRTMAWWATVSGIVTSIGMFFLAGTLWQTTRATNAATETARAAEEATRISRRSAEIQLRAYVFINNIESKHMKDPGTERLTDWIFTPVWRNSGQTPTIGAISCVNFANGVTPESSDFADNGQAGRSLFPPGHLMLAETFKISVDDLNEMRKGDRRAFIWGWVDYNDVFEGTPRHRHEFCIEILVAANPAFPNVGGGFHYARLGPFNGHDRECYRQPGPPPVIPT